MTIPDDLITAAAEAMCYHGVRQYQPCVDCLSAASRALTAAFAKLPVDELREQARAAVRLVDGKRGDPFGDFRADAASDVWLAALTGAGES